MTGIREGAEEDERRSGRVRVRGRERVRVRERAKVGMEVNGNLR